MLNVFNCGLEIFHRACCVVVPFQNQLHALGNVIKSIFVHLFLSITYVELIEENKCGSN